MKNVTSELWERFDWTNRRRNRSQWAKNWVMFQKQPSLGIPQAGRGDNHLLTLLYVLYVITFPHRLSQCSSAGSSVHSSQASLTPGTKTRGITDCYCPAFSAEGDPVPGELFGFCGVRGLYMFACCQQRLKNWWVD